MTIVKFQRGITTKLYRRTIRFLYFACRLMMLYISMKFMTVVVVIERTRTYHSLVSKGNV